MQKRSVQKIALAGIFVALAVVCSPFSIPVGIARCFPVQHLINVMAAVLLGPLYGVEIAFVSSLIRVLLGTGTILAFPGSMCGALLCGLVYRKSKNITLTCLGEMFGTGILGALLAYPVAVLFLNKVGAFYGFVLPFLASSAAGAIIAFILLQAFRKIFKERGE